MNNGVFRIEYPTGYMELNVREFFANANKKQMKKVLKLAFFPQVRIEPSSYEKALRRQRGETHGEHGSD